MSDNVEFRLKRMEEMLRDIRGAIRHTHDHVLKEMEHVLRHVGDLSQKVSRIAAMEKSEMGKVSDKVTEIAATVQSNKDAFSSVKAVLASQSTAIADLKALVESGADPAEVVAGLTAIDESLKGTNADMLAAAALANTPAAPQVPAAIASAVANQ